MATAETKTVYEIILHLSKYEASYLITMLNSIDSLSGTSKEAMAKASIKEALLANTNGDLFDDYE